ncbi:MAG: HlyD family efflux transporter periplasmic adaptor subunit [Lachnospiraceae bacterium]|jgi:HlyD family secretion protein|nr:HlyD family efflux transporter periplasmic adaptor subunit [Lachnospiraceae bacterium]MCI9202515.1 HlyD family efflux transporter periplasmic adaptor subunit [Lachnospiraceae bacterium]
MKERWKKDKQFRRSCIFAGLAFVILLGACVYTLFIQPNLSTETYVYKEETVVRGDLILGIMESGNLSLGESSVMYELDLEPDDEEEDEEDEEDDGESTQKYLKIEEVYAVSGQRISEGDVLFKLREDSVDAVEKKLESALTEAKIALSNAQTEYNISMLSAKSIYDSSVKEGSRAAADYQAAITAGRERIKGLEGEVKLLELEIALAQEKLADEELLDSYEEAKATYTSSKNKYEETDLHNSTAYTSNLSDYQQAKSQLESLEEELQGYRDTITDNQAEIEKKQKEIEEAAALQALYNQKAENDYQSASLSGELAKEIYDYSVDSLSDSVNKAQNELDEIQAKMDAFQAFAGEDNLIYAPEDGLVTGVFCEAGDKLTDIKAMLTYAKEDEYTVNIDVSEEDVAAISVGERVELSFSAYPEQAWEGVITSITTTSTSEHASTISYPVTILVKGDTTLLYGGMAADVTFVTESAEDVLYVSKKAVFEEEGHSYVYKKDANGNRVKTQVETGFSDTASIEVISGLEEGDVVYIESVMKVTSEKTGKEG